MTGGETIAAATTTARCDSKGRSVDHPALADSPGEWTGKDYGWTTDAAPILRCGVARMATETTMAMITETRTPSGASPTTADGIIVETMTTGRCDSRDKSVAHLASAGSLGGWTGEDCGSTTDAAPFSRCVGVRAEMELGTMATITMETTAITAIVAAPTVATAIAVGGIP